MIRKPDGPAVPRDRAPDAWVEAGITGPRHPLRMLKRRLVATQGVLAGGSIVASVVLYSVTGVESALAEAPPWFSAAYAFMGILVPAGHVGLVFLLISGVENAGRYTARGTWVLIGVHLAWGGGVAVGHVQALPIGLVLVVGDLLFLWWLRGARASLDAGERAPAGLP